MSGARLNQRHMASPEDVAYAEGRGLLVPLDEVDDPRVSWLGGAVVAGGQEGAGWTACVWKLAAVSDVSWSCGWQAVVPRQQ
jgi:hypothetical protein